MKIAFHSNQLGLRGTEVALYDYAHFNETLLHNQSIILSIQDSPNSDPSAIKKFTDRFPVFFYSGNFEEVDSILEKEKVDLLYIIDAGKNVGKVSKKVKTVVHAVFQYHEPHGDVYAYVSEWLSQKMTNGKVPFVPHMVHLPTIHDHLRHQFNIPTDAIVFGRYGGMDTFDIYFVRRAIVKIAKKYPHIYFLFMNTPDFVGKSMYRKKIINTILTTLWYKKKKYKNILFISPTSDMIEKTKFINTCDAMLHARYQGETFGIACGEFSIKNKPIITYSGKKCNDRAHINILREKGIYYQNYNDLYRILSSFEKKSTKNWDAYSEKYNPAVVMKKFKELFIG